MLKIDTEKMMICLTRGDTANIVFSAVDEAGTTYDPSIGDELRFSVAKKVGADPLFEIPRKYDGINITTDEQFWTVTIQPSNTNPLKFGDYAFDVQLTHDGEVDTIIGVTDEIAPTFRVWGEVATED